MQSVMSIHLSVSTLGIAPTDLWLWIFFAVFMSHDDSLPGI